MHKRPNVAHQLTACSMLIIYGESLLWIMSTSTLEPTIPTDHGHKAGWDSWMTNRKFRKKSKTLSVHSKTLRIWLKLNKSVFNAYFNFCLRCQVQAVNDYVTYLCFIKAKYSCTMFFLCLKHIQLTVIEDKSNWIQEKYIREFCLFFPRWTHSNIIIKNVQLD